MSRFVALWLLLGTIATLVTHAVSLAIFRNIDLTFTQFATLLVAPAVQAAVLTWPVGTLAHAARAITAARRHVLWSPLLLLDLLMLAAGAVWWSSSALGFGAPVTAQTTWIGVKAVAAAAVCLVAMRSVPRVDRAIVAIVLLLVAMQAFGEGLERLYAVIDRRAQGVPEVFLRLLFYGGLCGIVVPALLRAARSLHDEARFWMSVAMACAVVGTLVVLLSMFNSPAVVAPWRGLALVCASAGVTAAMWCVLAQSTPRPRQ